MPPVMRYAASGRHRNGSRTGSPEIGTRSDLKKFAVSQRQDGLGRRWQHRGQRCCAINDVVASRDVDQATPKLGLLGTDHAGESPQAALAQRRAGGRLADAAGDDPQRGRVAVIALGQPTDEIGHFRGQTDRARRCRFRRHPPDRARLGRQHTLPQSRSAAV